MKSLTCESHKHVLMEEDHGRLKTSWKKKTGMYGMSNGRRRNEERL